MSRALLNLVGGFGIEPKLETSKVPVLPLDDPPMILSNSLRLLPLPRHVKNDELEGKLLDRRDAHEVEGAEERAQEL